MQEKRKLIPFLRFLKTRVVVLSFSIGTTKSGKKILEDKRGVPLVLVVPVGSC